MIAYYGAPFTLYISLESQSTPGKFVTDPTIAAADFNVSKDDGTFAALTTTPTVDPSGSVQVKIELSATEMQADVVSVVCQDTAGDQWFDQRIDIHTTRVPYAEVDSVTSATIFASSDLSLSSTDDAYNDAFVAFLSGTNAGLAAKITDYTGATRTFTVESGLASPSVSDKFIVLGKAT